MFDLVTTVFTYTQAPLLIFSVQKQGYNLHEHYQNAHLFLPLAQP